jgi:Na+/melibiose symporter-like transporter
MRETRGIPIRKLLVEYIDIARQVAKTPRTLLIIGIMVILNITAAVSNNFFALYATQNLGIPDAWLAWFPIGRAIVMLIFIFTIQTALSHLSFRIPVLIGLILYIASQLILITTKPEQLLPLILYILLEAFAFALVIPQKDSMMVKFIDPVERARVSSIVYMSMIAISSPFGWIAGELSQRDRSWPFIMNMVLFSLCFLLIVYTKRIKLTDNT